MPSPQDYLDLPVPGTERSFRPYRPGLMDALRGFDYRFAKKAEQVGKGLISAFEAPGKALSGHYDQLPVYEDGSVGPFDPRMMDDASTVAGLLTLGTGAFPAEAGALNMGLRQRYRPYLSAAVDFKVDPNRMKLTPARIDAAKQDMLRSFDMRGSFGAPKRFGQPIEVSPYRQTEQALQAAEFAARARKAGMDARVKFADGPYGSVYVKAGDHGTVRFADHAQPRDWDGNVTGGYSATLGRRHSPATHSVDPSSGLTVQDLFRIYGLM